MDISCKQNKCSSCSLEDCLCHKCSCGQVHVCIACVGRYADDNVYKTLKIYCNQCKKIVNSWYEVYPF